MRCRIRHTGRVMSSLSVSDFTLAPGFTSPDFDLIDGSPDEMVIKEWEEEGLIEILPPNSAGKIEAVSRVGGRSKGRTLTAEEVRDNMARKKRRRHTALTRKERGMATHRPPVGSPFGPSKNARVFTAEDLAKGKPEAPAPKPPPDANELQDRSKEGRVYGSDEVPPAGTEIQAEGGKGTELTPEDLKKMNKNAVSEEVVEEIAKDATEEVPEDIINDTGEETVEEEMGEQPIDNLVLDAFVEKLDEMTKKEISAIAEAEDIEFPNQINKAPLVALVAEALARKGYTELPS